MPIDKGTTLAVGTKLVGKYKGRIYRAEVVEVEGQNMIRLMSRPRVTAGTRCYFRSLSGSALGATGIKTVPSGWTFWNIEAPSEERKVAAAEKAA